jgi:chorismate mutase
MILLVGATPPKEANATLKVSSLLRKLLQALKRRHRFNDGVA